MRGAKDLSKHSSSVTERFARGRSGTAMVPARDGDCGIEKLAAAQTKINPI